MRTLVLKISVLVLGLCGCMNSGYRMTSDVATPRVPFAYKIVNVLPTTIVSETEMPTVVKDVAQPTQVKNDYTGLWALTLGLIPACEEHTVAHTVTVTTPIGTKTGSYTVQAQYWLGWFPTVIPYPGSFDKREFGSNVTDDKLLSFAQEKRVPVINGLLSKFSSSEYRTFVKNQKNKQPRKENIATSKSTIAIKPKSANNDIASDELNFATNNIAVYKLLADKGNPRGLFWYGYFLLLQRDSRAFSYIKRSADNKYPTALHFIGSLYESGSENNGIEKDTLRAAELYKEAANLGSLAGKNDYGRCLMNGIGLKKDYQKGLELRVEAAKAGLSWVYMELATESRSIGLSRYCLANAMNAGVKDARERLLLEYVPRMIEIYKGKDVEFGDALGCSFWCDEDVQRSFWEKNECRVKFTIDECYAFYSEAAGHAQKSHWTDRGLGIIYRMMGLFTEKGYACQVDPVMGLRWYYRAIAVGDAKARELANTLEKEFDDATVEAIKKRENVGKKGKSVAEIEKLAKAAEASTFEMKGFYLGMNVEDAQVMAKRFLPNSRIVITADNNIEIDITHDKNPELDVQPMFFCQADKAGKVYRFNFEKKLLDKWFSFNVQTYDDWLKAYNKDRKLDFRVNVVEGRRDLGDVWLSVSQKTYRYRDQKKKFVATYFCNKTVLDPNEDVNMQSLLQNPNKAGKIAGVRAWVKNGWENGKGGREGTLRVEMLKD